MKLFVAFGAVFELRRYACRIPRRNRKRRHAGRRMRLMVVGDAFGLIRSRLKSAFPRLRISDELSVPKACAKLKCSDPVDMVLLTGLLFNRLSYPRRRRGGKFRALNGIIRASRGSIPIAVISRYFIYDHEARRRVLNCGPVAAILGWGWSNYGLRLAIRHLMRIADGKAPANMWGDLRAGGKDPQPDVYPW